MDVHAGYLPYNALGRTIVFAPKGPTVTHSILKKRTPSSHNLVRAGAGRRFLATFGTVDQVRITLPFDSPMTHLQTHIDDACTVRGG